jgi:amylosucrase
MMHSAMMCMAGFPMLSSGDEIAQLNGYGYHDDPIKGEDSRNLHRTPFNWDNAALRRQPGSVQQRVWDGLRQLEDLRRTAGAFGRASTVSTWDTHNRHVLALVRRGGGQTMVCLFNFSGQQQLVSLDGLKGAYTDQISGQPIQPSLQLLEPYQYALCLRRAREH